MYFLFKMSDTERIELVSQNDSDEEEVVLDGITENTTLRDENKQKVKSTDWRTLCCKALLILVAVIVFLAILMRSWSDYGVYITKHVFPPAIHSISTQCPENATYGGFGQQFYNAPTCDFECYGEKNTSCDYTLMKCVGEKPSNWFLQVTPRRNHIVNMTWDDTLVLNFSNWHYNTCIELVIWSI